MITYYALMTLVGFVLMGMDKLAALTHAWRTAERVFFGLALLGGGAGVFLGAFAFHHKTRKAFFLRRIGAAALIHVAIATVLALAL